MALEDIGMFRSIPNCVVFYPSDAVSCERAVELAANYKDMTFIRATRGNTPVIYANDESFEIGKAKVIPKTSSCDRGVFTETFRRSVGPLHLFQTKICDFHARFQT